ncbi:hypothetical protein [Paraburkholderia solisilvae]|uniref:Uncharacterized protein n=1 Tax=Paraburkholderia solisilvae TaxID=624376 RepID=A0A6J5DAZ8_9BURK|nr:hypothetical protein [Paraburkholderia solisilvae]CAB3750312.1 hypothetical protein LMG29739_01038 [Paraburkholderia solisilvae]
MLPSVHRESIPSTPHVEQVPAEVVRPGPSAEVVKKGGSSGSTGKVRIATHQNGNRPRSASGSTGAQSNWPQSYALAKLPDEYSHSPTPGVMVDAKGREFIVSGDRGYPVKYDASNRTWRIWQPDNPAKPGIPVTRSDDGTWRIHSDVGLKGGGDTQSQRFSELTNRKESVEAEMRRCQDRMMQLDRRSTDLARRCDEIDRRVAELERRSHGPASAEILYESARLRADALMLKREEDEINRERSSESSKFSYANIELLSIRRELDSINLSHWSS